jgi:hypothetical protein
MEEAQMPRSIVSRGDLSSDEDPVPEPYEVEVVQITAELPAVPGWLRTILVPSALATAALNAGFAVAALEGESAGRLAAYAVVDVVASITTVVYVRLFVRAGVRMWIRR